MSLSLYEFAAALEVFNTKILLLAVGVCVLTGIVKLFIPSKWRKFVTVIPFLLGILVCAGFDFFFEKVNPITPHTVSIGIQTGVASTIYYVVYNQFFKGKSGSKAAILTTLLASVVKKELVDDVVKKVFSAISEGGDDVAKKVFDTVMTAKIDGTTVEEIMLAVKAVINSEE